MHTKLNNKGIWRGHPSVMTYALADNGETVIPPGFESMIENTAKWIPSADDLYLEKGDMSDAILGAYASLNGTRVIAPHTAILDEILGSNGYTKKAATDAKTEPNQEKTVLAASEANNEDDNAQNEIQSPVSGIASCARRHIQQEFQPAESAKKLTALYRKILGLKG